MTKSITLCLFFLSFPMISPNNVRKTRQVPPSFNRLLCSNCKRLNTAGRVLNGEKIPINHSNFLASIFIEIKKKSEETYKFKITYKMVCTSTVLNSYWILSALYCSDELFEDDTRAFVAAGNDKSIDSNWFNDSHRSVILKEVRPSLIANENTDDIVLYNLKTPLRLGRKRWIFPACFLRKEITEYEGFLMSAGYGGIDENKLIITTGNFTSTPKLPMFKETYLKDNITVITRARSPSMDFLLEDKNETCDQKYICTKTCETCNGTFCREDGGAPLLMYSSEYDGNFVIGVMGEIKKIYDTTKSNSTNTVWIICNFNRKNRFIRLYPYLESFIVERIGANQMCLFEANETVISVPTKAIRRSNDLNKTEFLGIFSFIFFIIILLTLFFRYFYKSQNIRRKNPETIDLNYKKLTIRKSDSNLKIIKGFKIKGNLKKALNLKSIKVDLKDVVVSKVKSQIKSNSLIKK